MSATQHTNPQRRGVARSIIYLCAGLLTILIAFVGFWPSYFGPLLAGTLSTTRLIHVHAVVQVIWLALDLSR